MPDAYELSLDVAKAIVRGWGSSGVGSEMDWLLLAVALNIALCFIVSNVAQQRGESPLVYFALSFFFSAIVALLILLVSSNAGAQPRPAPTSDEHSEKWRALVDLDPDVAAAAEQVRALGPRYEEMLAKKYLAIGDKSYLKAAVEFVQEKAASAPMDPEPVPIRKVLGIYKGHQLSMEADGSVYYAGGREFPSMEEAKQFVALRRK